MLRVNCALTLVFVFNKQDEGEIGRNAEKEG